MGTTVQIKEVTENLICKYAGQCNAQPAYIELDCRTGILTAGYNPEIGNAIPFSVYHGHDQRWGIPYHLTENCINGILESIEGFCQTILDGYESVWDGNNHRARFTDEAQEAIEMIDDVIASYPVEEYFIVESWEDWFQNGFHDELGAMRNFETADEWSEHVVDYAKGNNAVIETSQTPVEWAMDRAEYNLLGARDLEELEDTIADLPNWMVENEKISEVIKEERKYWEEDSNDD